MFVCCECCVLPGRGLCDGLITRPVRMSVETRNVLIVGFPEIRQKDSGILR